LVRLKADDYTRALVLEQILSEAVDRLGNGPYGKAASLLLGTASEARGLLLKVRRRLAAEELGVLPSTFRKNYERALIEDIAVEIWRAANRPRS
jgi:hypothetical protein